MLKTYADLKDHPLVVVICAVVAASGVTFGVVKYFYGEKLSILHSKYELTHKSIDREITENSSFDVSDILINKDDFDSIELNSDDVTEFTNDRFFTAKPAEGWSYNLTDQYQYARTILDVEKLDYIDTGIATHLWKYEKNHYTGKELYKDIYPHIVVQRIPLQYLRELFKSQLNENSQKMQTSLKTLEKAIRNQGITLEVAKQRIERALGTEVSKQDMEVVLKQLEKYYYSDEKPSFDDGPILMDSLFAGDVVALVFLQSIAFDIAINSPPLNNIGKYELVTVQKKHNVLYMKSKARLPAINEKNISKNISLYKEHIIIATLEDLYSVNIILPSESLILKKTSEWIFTQTWIENFKIIEQ